MDRKRQFIFGVILLAIGIFVLVTGSGSRAMAYGDFVLAFVLFALSACAGKKTGNDSKENEEPDEEQPEE